MKKYFAMGLLSLLMFSCKDAYRPDVVSSPNIYLVVEGVLTLSGPANVKISRTTKLDNASFNAVLNAQVKVEGKDNTVRTMASAGGGNYSSPGLNLTLGNEYRLRIHTTDGKEYLSDYVIARQTPPIDSIGWRLKDGGLQIYANSHDASDNTRYYRWDYDETWEIRAYYYSRYIYIPASNTVRERTPSELVYTGWKYNTSSQIILASSARLQSDIIFEAPIAFIPQDDEKLSVRYSILLRQYSLDKAGYDFYELMKKNTESIGTIFDPQPSEIRGNIYNVADPKEPVIGYVTAASVSEKRIFISNADVPGWAYYQDCPYFKVPNNPDSFKLFFGGQLYSPFDAIYSSATGALEAYQSSYPHCVDVTKRGASTVKPPYW